MLFEPSLLGPFKLLEFTVVLFYDLTFFQPQLFFLFLADLVCLSLVFILQLSLLLLQALDVRLFSLKIYFLLLFEFFNLEIKAFLLRLLHLRFDLVKSIRNIPLLRNQLHLQLLLELLDLAVSLRLRILQLLLFLLPQPLLELSELQVRCLLRLFPQPFLFLLAFSLPLLLFTLNLSLVGL